MTTYNNAPPVDGWQLPPRCCGEWVSDDVCPLCMEYVVSIPANVTLAEN